MHITPVDGDAFCSLLDAPYTCREAASSIDISKLIQGQATERLHNELEQRSTR